jgi:hypothetical protein
VNWGTIRKYEHLTTTLNLRRVSIEGPIYGDAKLAAVQMADVFVRATLALAASRNQELCLHADQSCGAEGHGRKRPSLDDARVFLEASRS